MTNLMANSVARRLAGAEADSPAVHVLADRDHYAMMKTHLVGMLSTFLGLSPNRHSALKCPVFNGQPIHTKPMFESELSNLGLSDKEAAVYLASLELGPSTIQEIARKTGLVRTTVYSLLASLQKKKLMTQIYQDRKSLFAGASPERLLTLARIQEEEAKEKTRALQNALLDLRGFMELSRFNPKIKLFRGKEGIRQIQDDIMNSKGLTTIEEFVPLDEAHALFPPHRRDHRHKMLKAMNRTFRKVVYTSKRGVILPAKERLMENRFAPPGKFPLSREFDIYGDQVGVVAYGRKPTGMILEGKQFADSLRAIFYWMWW